MSTPQNRLRSNQGTRTLGPISDLERHLPQEWWRTLFNAVYLKTDGDVVENDINTSQEVDVFLEATGLTSDQRILDLCCGQGRHSIALALRGYTGVVGLDRSRYLIRLAKKRADRLGVTVSFKEGDARKFRMPERSFDAVAMFGNSFGYFERAEDDLAVLKQVRRVLKSNGFLFMDLADGDWMRKHYEPRSWEWVDQNHFVCRERALASDSQRLVSREVVTHAERGVIADQFYAERLYSRDEIKDLVERAGFTEAAFMEAPVTHSGRQQDLGMMAHRLLLVARVPEKPKATMRRGPHFPNVTVLLGDPGLPDIVKLGGQFNPEDIATVGRMKEALESLPGYTFNYWDDHKRLPELIREQRPEFVLNLCDEGFLNDAFKELHVPALLEVYGIPYSGAGPASLGWCYNKSFVRAVAQSIEIPAPLESYFSPDDQAATLPSVFPVLLKPNLGDSSQGITQNAVVHTQEDFAAYLEELRRNFPKRSLLVQEFLNGPEYSVGVVGNPGFGFTVLPLLEVDYSGLEPGLPRILGYESKWEPESPYWNQIRYFEAHVSDEAKRQLIDYSLLLFERLDCRDYARFDFRTDSQGEIKLLEVNPNPGWCWDGKLNYMAGFGGMAYTDLLRLIVEAAQERCAASPVPRLM
ncbi:MAG: methyltransferase domain-containing protein [Candidatus Hydrogenedens sp.]|nr:methyltransferase domain-containing protein [Candidatus Hydrogenedens sp.]